MPANKVGEPKSKIECEVIGKAVALTTYWNIVGGNSGLNRFQKGLVSAVNKLRRERSRRDKKSSFSVEKI